MRGIFTLDGSDTISTYIPETEPLAPNTGLVPSEIMTQAELEQLQRRLELSQELLSRMDTLDERYIGTYDFTTIYGEKDIEDILLTATEIDRTLDGIMKYKQN